jgi:pyruvate,water dikinase
VSNRKKDRMAIAQAQTFGPTGQGVVVDLADARAADARVAGAKAANLARALHAGLTVLPGFVLTTAIDPDRLDEPPVQRGLEAAWQALQGRHPGPVVVRSSSTVEDASASSMAGQFTSVLDVDSFAGLRAAVARVLASAHGIAIEHPGQPMAVLVQPQLDPTVGGVLFGVDPVSGDRHHVVVDAVGARPDDLVSGRVTAAHYVLSRRGRVLEAVHRDAAPPLSPSLRRRLVHLARVAQHTFGSPQDVEWATDEHDALWLLQSRPVTAVSAAPVGGALLGPGPVAETFPAPLGPLEADLWVPPLREGLARALETTGTVARRHLRASPVMTTVGGRVAVDLELLGVVRTRRSRWRLLDPRPGARRLLAAWRVGRLRVALPALARSCVETVDADLAAVDDLAAATPVELVHLLELGARELATVHTLEVLSGMLLRDDGTAPPLPLVAMRALARGRAEGLTDSGIVTRYPEVLALVPPALDATAALPETPNAVEFRGEVDDLGPRDALRLRARWLQEFVARVARELARQLAARGALARGTLARDCTVRELSAMVDGASAPVDLPARVARRPGPPLPATFRLTANGDIVPKAPRQPSDGVPAGGGRGVGVVCHAANGSFDGGAGPVVLVVANLEPQLAALLPELAGLVAETGSPLSHLAILAREMHVPTVVAVAGARERFPVGSRVVVDGTSGEVTTVDEEVGR